MKEIKLKTLHLLLANCPEQLIDLIGEKVTELGVNENTTPPSLEAFCTDLQSEKNKTIFWEKFQIEVCCKRAQRIFKGSLHEH